MKFSIVLLLASLSFLVPGQIFCQTPAAEEAAIKAVIERETARYFEGDVAGRDQCLTQNKNTLFLNADPGNLSLSQGFDAIHQAMTDAFRQYPGPWKGIIRQSNWNIHVSGDVAWATFDGEASYESAPGFVFHTKEIRCLEKSGGQWRISVEGAIDLMKTDTPAERDNIKKVCQAETQAWLDADLEAWKATHLQGENDALSWANTEGLGVMTGWKNIEASIADAMKTAKKSADKLASDNFQFTFYGNAAFVAFDQKITSPDGKVTQSREYRMMAFSPWTNGWKIQAVMAFYPK